MLRIQLASAFALSLFASSALGAPLIYQGELSDGGKPANGYYDLQLTPYRDAKSSTQLAAPVTLAGVKVENGHFQVEAEFGDGLIPEQEAYLQLAVRDGGSGAAFESIPGRQKATAAAATIGTCWSSTGDAGSNPATNFLGTTDNQPLVLRVNNFRAARINPSPNTQFNPDAPDVILGSSANTAAATLVGATISGGGDALSDCGSGAVQGPCANSVTDNWGTVGGGLQNTAAYVAVVSGGIGNSATNAAVVSGGFYNNSSGNTATIAGGNQNVASGQYASIAGGDTNLASGKWSTVLGGYDNIASQRGSLAAGQYALAVNNGAFVWGDDSTGIFDPNPYVSSTADNQFVVRAIGGFGLNAPPYDPNVEMTITANASASYANLLMHQKEFNDGVLISVGNATSGANNATFLIDQYNGNAQTQTRRLTLAGNGDFTVTANAFKPGGGTWTTTSDRRVKQDIAPLEDPLEKLQALRPVEFRYTPAYRAAQGGLADKPYFGFVAQEYAEVFPEAVSSTGVPVPGAAPQDTPILALDPNPALITTVAAAQELARRTTRALARIDADERALAQLREENAQLQVRLDALEHVAR